MCVDLASENTSKVFLSLPGHLSFLPSSCPPPVLLRQLRNHHLEVLASNPVNSSHVQLLRSLQVLLPLSRRENAGRADITDVSAIACFF